MNASAKMSDDSDGKKHEASSYKLQESRKHGRWFASRDLTAATVLATTALLWSAAFPFVSERAVAVARSAWQPERLASPEPLRAMEETVRQAAESAALMVALFLVGIFSVAALTQFAQVGPMFSADSLWRSENLNPARGFKRIVFGIETYQMTAIAMLKASLILALSIVTVWNMIANLFLASRIGVLQTAKVFNASFTTFLWQAAILSGLFGAADYLIRKRQFMRELRMTDKELKDEYRRFHGDPTVKQQIRQRQAGLTHFDGAPRG
jgi:flagellar biosynthetic protein FlhB